MKSCEYVFESIRFDINAICSCCANRWGIYIPVDETSDVDEVMNTYFDKVNKIAAGIPTESDCDGCFKLDGDYIKKYPIENGSKKIQKIYVCNWRYCNIDCIYCVYRNEKKNVNNYSILPYIHWLKNENKIADNAELIFGGGEPGILKEIDEIFNEFPQSKISIMSNFVVFRPIYEGMLKGGNFFINVSLDSANRELYKLIHNADCFDKVIDNIKYARNCAKDKYQITLKYIFVENQNDKKEYIDEFINLAKDLKISTLGFDFDRAYYNIEHPIPQGILDLYEYAKIQTKQNGMELFIDPRAETMFNAKRYI